MVRWPSVYSAFARIVLARPPRSRLRRIQLRRAVLSGWSAWARDDLDLVLVRYARNCRLEVPPAFVDAGMKSAYNGHAGEREYTDDLRESFERMDITPLELVDAGDRFVVLGRFHICARGSGVELDSKFGSVYWIEDGLCVRERMFLDWDAALRAAEIPTTAAASESPARHQATA
jgi:ketosteroid isomerase-like protein